jgi:hypothetical protein
LGEDSEKSFSLLALVCTPIIADRTLFITCIKLVSVIFYPRFHVHFGVIQIEFRNISALKKLKIYHQ